ncbi:MAG TPA: BT_3928 family protein [Chitinophagaceae bacterium]|nr:BT_3928 family protein [Chitinophagaceae bacterium]
MKIAVNSTRIIVGLLFIFSGLVKANDPLGLSYKMQEFFELWGMAQFNSWTLALSLAMIAFEIIAGAALLLGWQMKLFSWLLLALIIFFTFLTGYAYLSGKFKNCGCFGDCIPITAQTSFLKDIVLTLMILFLFRHRDKIRPMMSGRATLLTMGLVTLFSFGIQWYSLTYLPLFDCLPYKKGNNIPEQMKMPANAIPDSTVITFVYEKDGKQVEFTADQFPADFNDSYKFVNRYDKIIRKGKNNEPPIKGFSLVGAGGQDSTQSILSHPYTILAFFENFSTPVSKWQKDFSSIYSQATSKNIPVYLVTGNKNVAEEALGGTSFQNIPVLTLDFTAIRTAARTSPCYYLLQKGTIQGKWSYKNSADLLEMVEKLSVQPVEAPANNQVLPVDSSSTPGQ